MPPALATTGRIDIPVRVTANDTPMAIGTAGTSRDGREYKPSPSNDHAERWAALAVRDSNDPGAPSSRL
jgi:hypothetical protein